MNEMSDAKPPEIEISEQRASPSDLTKAMEAINQYNRKFGLGGLLSFTLDRALSKAESESINPNDPFKAFVNSIPEQSFEDQQSTDATILDLENSDRLKKLGLELLPAKGTSFAYTPEGRIDTGKVRVSIGNKERLLAFLESLSQEDAGKAEVQTGLMELANSFSSQLMNDVDFEHPTDFDLNLITSLNDISATYNSLGLGQEPSVILLRQMGKYATQGCLKEYIVVRKAGLFNEGFGPRNWHTDGEYRDKWEVGLQALASLKEKPKTAGLAEDLRSFLLSSSQGALEDLDSDKYPWVAPRKDGELRPYFQGVVQKLQQV